ncbi:follistatin-related protein 1-like [Melanotaenia boesemani]|uniref:follistatin-related protein 1-like n=1 Tax=Melanotaenia boesemani TaxID=1250792 RepID=UPI001C056A6D|nr:follistatin-related protein 1-like [Melanotaenia boesemani]XP_041865483.1 follistatin-related protein 1-like [Melanotaenia boesemani]XP_041865484.1 follistatin-related protein 1-like [Melanotaenia boesemani]
MLTTFVLLLSLLLFSLSASSPLAKDQSVCSRTFCGAGRECVSTDRGEPVCRCLEQCDESEHWVCGSNGKSYRNHCELHRDACISQTKVHVERRGHCVEKLTKTDVSPIVCFLSDRDWLRERVIQWIQIEVESDHLTFNLSSATDVLQMYFQTYDNGDYQLDSKEFLRFLKHNDTALNLTFSDSLETNQLLRSLCVDALIELSDENADWKLSLTEFINCLTPTYHPPERKCALEDEVFEDGAETQMECNRCVCACGNWVCTALTCNGEHQVKEDVQVGEEEEEMTEEEWSRRVAELNALQENFTL